MTTKMNNNQWFEVNYDDNNSNIFITFLDARWKDWMVCVTNMAFDEESDDPYVVVDWYVSKVGVSSGDTYDSEELKQYVESAVLELITMIAEKLNEYEHKDE